MWRLFNRFYADVTREMFAEDLAWKRDVILCRDSGDGELRGFSTLALFRRVVDGRKVVAIFSGDTIIEPEYWGQTALQRQFFLYILKQKARHPFSRVYWFLISKGYKTYLLLSRNFVEYWPRWDRPTPTWQANVIGHMASELYGEAWQPGLGVLRFTESKGRLREAVAPIEPSLLAHDDIRFFAEKNPGHAGGDELCCLGRVDPVLAISYSVKLLGKLGKRVVRPLLPAPAPESPPR